MTAHIADLAAILQAAFSFLIVVFAPGFTLCLWLFPRGTLDRLERVFLSVTSSIALSSLVGFGLLRIFGTLNAGSYVLAVSLLIIVFAIGALSRSLWRSHRRDASQRLVAHGESSPLRLRSEYLLVIPVAMILIISMRTLSPLPVNPSFATSEFYISPQKLEQVLDMNLGGDGSLAVPVEIKNREGQEVTYRIETWADGKSKIGEIPEIAISSEAIWQGTIAIPSAASTELGFLDFRLFSSLRAYRVAELRLWLGPNHWLSD